MGQTLSRSEHTRRKGRSGDTNSAGAGARSPVQYRDHRTAFDRTYPGRERGDGMIRSTQSSRRISTSTSKRSQRREDSELETQRRSRDVPKVPGSRHGSHNVEEEKRVSTEPSTLGRRHHNHSEPTAEEKQECIVCTDTRSVSRFPERPPTSECQHESNVCRRCLRTWITSQFETKMWDDIKCPLCPSVLQYADMRISASRDTFTRYEDLSARAHLEALPNFTWCGLKACKSGQLHNPAGAKFRCVVCKKAHCIRHGIKWHKGETCDEYDYRTNGVLKAEEEEASKVLISVTSKQCPGCKRPIEKSAGCDHMTCVKCKHQFCWHCLAPYVKNKHSREVAHQPGCIHLPEQVEYMGLPYPL